MSKATPAYWTMLMTDAAEFTLPEAARRALAQERIEIREVAGHDPAAIVARGRDCQGLFLFRARIDGALLDQLPFCCHLSRIGTGYDAIDVEAARQRGVMVTYLPDFCTEELSDHVMACILGYTRQFPYLIQSSNQRQWRSVDEVPMPRRLRGRSLGILGFGRSGRRTAEKARAFGMEVRIWTRTPRPEAVAQVGAQQATLEEVLGCDFVSLHLPLSEGTRHLINRETLALMQPDAVLINIARGGVVNTNDLVEALQSGRLAGAALDVVDPAPLPSTHPLWSLPNVWITSHTAALSVEGSVEAWATAVEDVVRVRDGRGPLHCVPELLMPG